MGKERFIKQAVWAFRSTKEIVKNKPVTVTTSILGVAGEAGAGASVLKSANAEEVITSVVLLAVIPVAVASAAMLESKAPRNIR